jgi:hypothetical protein
MIKEWQVGITCFSERNINWNQENKQDIRQCLKLAHKQGIIFISNYVMEAESYHKQRWTDTIMTDKLIVAKFMQAYATHIN